eukprot:5936801-Alexandrium_andersonii.AAC.1
MRPWLLGQSVRRARRPPPPARCWGGGPAPRPCAGGRRAAAARGLGGADEVLDEGPGGRDPA